MWKHVQSFVVATLLVGLLGVGALGLVGVPAAHADEGTTFEATFASESLRLDAYFSEGGVYLVLSDGRELWLPQTVSASGARYADGDTVFWNKGNDAFVQLDGVEHVVTVIDEKRDIWERARREGVTFRGVGQEPGWLVEVVDGLEVRLTLDYGQTLVTTPLVSKEINYVDMTTVFRTWHDTYGHYQLLDIVVTVDESVCYDTMSGEGFTSTVTVQIGDGDRVYDGCGRWLAHDSMHN